MASGAPRRQGVNLRGQGEVEGGESSGIVGGQVQPDTVPGNRNVRVVTGFFRKTSDRIHERQGRPKIGEVKVRVRTLPLRFHRGTAAVAVRTSFGVSRFMG